MPDSENWRTEVTGLDYLTHQKKKLSVADRRPLIRKPSDIVGPGIGPSATRVTDWNDVLATFNGFFSSAAGATNAPEATLPYVGFVVSDSTLGGAQELFALTTDPSEKRYRRVFVRNPSDPNKLYWGPWILA